MCRLLFVKSEKEFQIHHHLKKFAAIAKNSKEYQGHGWGCAFLVNDEWRYYKNIHPVWEDDFVKFGTTTQLIVHARSAFEDRDIIIENNMPFYDDRYVFVFNGELRGVKIKESGRIGAEKIFNYIKRFDKGDFLHALVKGIAIIEKKTQYIRAMNIIVSDKQTVYVASQYHDDPEYFTIHYKQSNGELIICSEQYPDENNWQKITNNTIKVFTL